MGSQLNVIGLISGGKDSFFSLLHCVAHGHRIVALANLYPGGAEKEGGTGSGTMAGSETGAGAGPESEPEPDLNSFMYQTVGHQVIPLYAEATGLPLYREAIVGRAVQEGRDYAAPEGAGAGADETECMTSLLRRVMQQHPEADAVCAGALLSTYQRTRVESVAVRLGLTALAYLWRYPLLPGLAGRPTDYLADLSSAGFDARIVKVASAGFDEALLWTNVASTGGRARMERALQRLGLDAAARRAALLGEGGEYETLVLDGPAALFRQGRICVGGRGGDPGRVVNEGGGSTWLLVQGAAIEAKDAAAADTTRVDVNKPAMLDQRWVDILQQGGQEAAAAAAAVAPTLTPASTRPPITTNGRPVLATWTVLPPATATNTTPPPITDAMQSVVDEIRARLAGHGLRAGVHIVRTVVLLRRMSDFGAINGVYGSLFTGPGSVPNPPARVTVSCGDGLDLLAPGADVAVVLTVRRRPEATAAITGQEAVDWRQGLHVQSRSYWAPANIGPYSQAVSVQVAAGQSKADNADDEDDGGSETEEARLVFVAGQIPLVPATMDLPSQAVEAAARGRVAAETGKADAAANTASFAFQATLALQHLWRIGAAMDVQWWSSGIAYVPRSPERPERSDQHWQDKAIAVSRIWQAAHRWQRPGPAVTASEDGEDDGPDLWDRKYDARYALYSGGDSEDDSENPALPDWTAAAGGEAGTAVPPVFLAEIDALPRGAMVEWHVPTGLSGVKPGRLYTETATETEEAGPVTVYRTVLLLGKKEQRRKQPGRRLCLTTRSWAYEHAAGVSISETVKDADVVFVDGSASAIGGAEGAVAKSGPAVPCASLWNGRGERLAAVAIYTLWSDVAV